MALRRSAALLTAFVALVARAGPAGAGHEIPFYPSFYPQEIKLQIVDPAGAARLLQKKVIHAYVGADPFPSGSAPAHVTYAESFGSFVVLTFNRPGGALLEAGGRCAAAARTLRALATVKADFTVHPYPVTPYHDDYVQHFDLAQAARRRLEVEAAGPLPRIRARGRLAEALRAAGARPADGETDATLEEIDLRGLLAAQETRLNGWLGPPWLKEGWFQAYLLQGGSLTDTTVRHQVEEAITARLRGEPEGAVERINAERRLVALLGRGCERVVVGYGVKRQALSDDYSDGVERVAHDAQAGLASAIFLRTVKLKDFPWNGWLTLGVESRPLAAWNPVAGLGDETGRVVWSAIGDPALFPAPQSGGWVPNRVRIAAATSVAVDVPPEAVLPDRLTGALRPVGPGIAARGRVVYRVLASAFHDGTRMSVADILYPFAFAQRWSIRATDAPNRYDPAVDRASALLRESLAGVKVVRVDTEIKDFGEVQFLYDVPQVEVYLRRPFDARALPVLAPPWSAVPWQLTALMEEAVTRGLAAFSEAEAKRRGVPWLDLARDARLREALMGLAESLERRAYVPEALRGLVTVDQARQRWAALRRFARRHGHFLVTNGPYQLGKWSADTIVLPVFRDLTYPWGVGAFDGYAWPRRAYAARVERRGDRLEFQADVDTVTRFERSYKIVREPFRPDVPGESLREAAPVAQYAVVGPGDDVVAAGSASEMDAGKLVLDLRGRLKPGAYRVLVALVLNGNLVNPEVKVIPYRVTD